MAVRIHIFYIFSLSLCVTQASSVLSKVQLPANVTVLRGSDAQINATVATQWTSMTWTVNGILVLIFKPSDNSTGNSGRYSASLCIDGDTACVQFTIQKVTRNDMLVECDVLGLQGSETRLYVQESGAVNIRGGNVTVAQDQQVQFQCDTSAWYPEPTVSWVVNGVAADNNQYNTTSVAGGDFFNSTSVLNFQAVSSGTVECRATIAALGNPMSSSVSLTVDVKPPDWTVLIAVVVSIGGLGLVAFLIIVIVLCCRHRKKKKSNYQNEMIQRVRTQSELNGPSAAAQDQGYVNSGYLSDSQSRGSLSGFVFSSSSATKMPANYVPNYGREGISTVTDSSFTKHRHATIV